MDCKLTVSAGRATLLRTLVLPFSILLSSCHSLNYAPGSAYMVKPVKKKPQSACESVTAHKPHYQYGAVPRNYKDPSEASLDPNKQCHPI